MLPSSKISRRVGLPIAVTLPFTCYVNTSTMAALVDPTGAIVTDLNIDTVANIAEESTLQNLRAIQHKDAFGNDIGMCLEYLVYTVPPLIMQCS